MTGTTLDKGTISVRLVHEALLELRRRGLDDSGLLNQAGIPAELLDKPYGRVSSQLFGQLWLLIARTMDDELFGMNPRRMKLGSFAYLTRQAVKEHTVGAALEQSMRLLDLIVDGLSPRLEWSGGVVEIALDQPEGEQFRAFAYFTLWLMIHGLLCWLAGRRIPILSIDLRCAVPEYIEDYQVLFSPNLRFARPQSRLRFNAECLELPVRRSARELKRFLGGLPANILVRYRDPQSLAARIRDYLRSIKPECWPNLDALSSHFYMAPTTLRRKLSLEGQPYQGLKDQVRHDLAIARLESGKSNITELAFELGFADTSAFYKAFKKWTGSTPVYYRSLMHSDQSRNVL